MWALNLDMLGKILWNSSDNQDGCLKKWEIMIFSQILLIKYTIIFARMLIYLIQICMHYLTLTRHFDKFLAWSIINNLKYFTFVEKFQKKQEIEIICIIKLKAYRKSKSGWKRHSLEFHEVAFFRPTAIVWFETFHVKAKPRGSTPLTQEKLKFSRLRFLICYRLLCIW